MQTCYMCDAPKTSDEHVPPKCLFPEKKDSPTGADYRKNLIKVPSCDVHNSAKSKEDEFFLMYMAANANAFASQAANLHQKTKLLRILDRKPHVWAMLLAQATPAQIVGNDGVVHNTCSLHIEASRFYTQMEHVAKGVYFNHYGKKWTSNVVIIPIQGLLTDNYSANIANQKTRKLSVDLFFDIDKNGENQDVFYYQILEGSSGVLVLAVFYENVKVVFLYS